jgi:hypothetical protein
MIQRLLQDAAPSGFGALVSPERLERQDFCAVGASSPGCFRDSLTYKFPAGAREMSDHLTRLAAYLGACFPARGE